MLRANLPNGGRILIIRLTGNAVSAFRDACERPRFPGLLAENLEVSEAPVNGRSEAGCDVRRRIP